VPAIGVVVLAREASRLVAAVALVVSLAFLSYPYVALGVLAVGTAPSRGRMVPGTETRRSP
jgi:hypothetical protein